MKKTLYAIFTAIIITLALVPFAGQLFPGLSSENGSSEQRDLASMPELFENGSLNLSFTEELGDYFSDHFALRTLLVNASSYIKRTVFRVSSVDDVVIGKDDYLYYSETTDDYIGANAGNESAANRIAVVISLEQEYVTGCGIKYVFTVAPNKNTIVPEYMPARFIACRGSTFLDKVAEKLKAENVNYADLKSELLKNNTEEIYFKQDSHWNYIGARIAYNCIIEAAGLSDVCPDYSELTFESAVRTDDLRKMLYPLDTDMEETAAKWPLDDGYTYTKPIKSLDDLTISANGGSLAVDGLSVLMHRDSFGRALIPMISTASESSVYVRSVPFDIYKYVKSGEITLCVNEIVERNLETLLETAPVVPAPERDNDVTEKDGVIKFTQPDALETETNSDGLTKVYGYCALAEEKISAGYRVYAVAGGTVYEGFPTYEKDLEEKYGAEDESRAGFCFYFEEIAPAADEITVYIAPIGD